MIILKEQSIFLLRKSLAGKRTLTGSVFDQLYP